MDKSKRKNLKLELSKTRKIHRRSVSQLMEEMGKSFSNLTAKVIEFYVTWKLLILNSCDVGGAVFRCKNVWEYQVNLRFTVVCKKRALLIIKTNWGYIYDALVRLWMKKLVVQRTLMFISCFCDIIKNSEKGVWNKRNEDATFKFHNRKYLYIRIANITYDEIVKFVNLFTFNRFL